MDAARRWIGKLAFPLIGLGYFVWFSLDEVGGWEFGTVPPGRAQLVLGGFAVAIGLVRRRPRTAVLVAAVTVAGATTAAATLWTFADTGWPALVAMLIVCTVAGGRPRARWWALGLAAAGAPPIAVAFAARQVYRASTGPEYRIGDVLDASWTWSAPALLVLLAGWVIGAAFGLVQERAAERSAAERRAAELRVAERELAASLEHERIAREIHDVVAHSLASIVAQADGARFLGERAARVSDAAGESAAALESIAERGRESLVEVRRLLDALAAGDADANPGIEDLPALLAGLERAGLTVRLEADGEPGPLAPASRRAAYRIVQECLTNALRHGDSSREAVLTLEWRGPGLGIEVVSARRADPAAAGDSGGRGIAGMQERARLVGGWLAVDPEDARGFAVTAFLPVLEVAAVASASSGPATGGRGPADDGSRA